DINLISFPTRRSSVLAEWKPLPGARHGPLLPCRYAHSPLPSRAVVPRLADSQSAPAALEHRAPPGHARLVYAGCPSRLQSRYARSEEHTSELQSLRHL